MPNYFTGNSDLQFQFDHLALEQIVALAEDDYDQAKTFDFAPSDYQDAMDNYRQVLAVVGAIAGDFIAPRASGVDLEGATLEDGKVRYASGIQQSLEQLSKAELMGMTLPRTHGGLNFPITVFTMAVELVSRADASLMNLFGLQDIAETIHKFGTEAQHDEFLPKLASGACTGAMVLTEPDAGSDLQAVKLQAYQDEHGQWFLRGVKRFITNGCGEILLVLARSEPKSRDGRGLSLFVCYGDDTVKVRRIEDKLGIHGSPTCELQFNDTPAQLVGRRKFGLIKYVMDLMNGARLAVSAQALGIAQAAYEEALTYAKARKQFGQSIYHIPAVTNMLLDMRVTLEANRSLLYATAKWVDLRDKLAKRVERLKQQDKPYSEQSMRQKEAAAISSLLTPLTKYVLTESANQVAYDALQIHGGAGYMKDFQIERLVRDARITNIYEGTSQLQVVAATGGVTKDLLADHFAGKEATEYPGPLSKLADQLKQIRLLFADSLKLVTERGDKHFEQVAAKPLVEMYGALYVGYLLLDEAGVDSRKVFIANRYIIGALSNARKQAESIANEQFSDLLHADEILR